MTENGRNKIIVELDLFNYPTKSDVKKYNRCDQSLLKKIDLTSSKSEVQIRF